MSEVACLSVENGSVFVFGTYRESTFSYTDGQGVLHAYPWSFDTYELDFFVLALNEDGSEKWAQEIEQGSDVTSGYGMDSDCNGLYLTGSGHASFFNPMIFPGGLYFNNFDHDDIWACGLNLETGEANWIKAFNTYGDSHADIGFGASTDGKGNVYITGVHESTIYVDGLELEHGEDQDLFVAAMNGSGEVNWMISIQSDENDLGCALDAYATDKLVIAGLGGSDLSFGGNALSENSDNALLMSLTVPENNGFLCCDLTEITLSAQHTSVCNGEPVRLNSSEFYPGLVVQSNSGFGWTDLLSLSTNEAVIYPTLTKTYRLAYFGDGCSFTSNEVSISVSEAEGIGPGGPRCGLRLWLRGRHISQLNGWNWCS